MIIAKQNETRDMYEKNLNILTPWLRESMEGVSEDALWEKIEVTYNTEGYPICRYHNNGICFHITSEQPVREAETWRKTLSDEGAPAVFLYGAGFGYAVFEVLAHKKPHTLVVVFEEDLYLFKAMLYYFDFEPVIKTEKIVFLIGDSEYFTPAFENLYCSINFISCTSPVIAYTFIAQRNFKKKYLEIHKNIFPRLSLMVSYLGNDHRDNLIGFVNLLENVKEILKNPHISCLKDRYKDAPAFIIANGPSLDQNIHQLKKIDGRGLMLCLESATVPVYKNNIKPDIIAVIERTKNTYKYHFKNKNYSSDTTLLALALADKHVFPSFPGAKIPIFREKEVLNIWMDEYFGDGSVIDAGANVSHLATELALYMGADPIVFVGQDYAYGPDDTTHSKDSIYFEERGRKARELIQAWPAFYVEGNDGETIRSNQLWTDFKQGLEQKIALHRDRTFINATEGGARISGTKCERLNDVIDKYCLKEIPCRVNEIIAQNKPDDLTAQKEHVKGFIQSIGHYKTLFRDMVRDTTAGKLDCKKMLCLMKENDGGQYNGILEDTYRRNIDLFARIITDGICRGFSQQVVFANYYMINRLKMIDTPEKIGEVFKIHYNFLCQLNVVCQSISIHMENAAEMLKNVLNSLENHEEME